MAVEIKARRRALELSQEDLAGRCELDRPYISLMEVARKQPTISVLLRLAISRSATLDRPPMIGDVSFWPRRCGNAFDAQIC
nr:helix-turn-helix transcriptional regulator [Polaromonas sp. 16-63-31]